MGAIKNAFFDKLEQMGELHDEDMQECMINAAMQELEDVIQEHTIPDYVVLTTGHRCYLGDDCDPMNDVCSC